MNGIVRSRAIMIAYVIHPFVPSKNVLEQY